MGRGLRDRDGKGEESHRKGNVAIENPAKGMEVRMSLINADGKCVASAKKRASADNSLTMTVPDVKLWSLENPYLYTLRTEVTRDGKVVDSSDIPVGIRTLAFNPDTGFALNGKNMKVKGVCIHHDA